MTKIAIPDGYDYIEAGSFKGCSSLTEIAIGDSVISLGYTETDGKVVGAFTGCPATTYYFKGENVPIDEVKNSGIGTDANGNPISGVTVWTKEDSSVWTAIDEINDSRPEGTKINLEPASDPYSMNTVDPGNNSGGATPSETKGVDGTPYGKGASASVAEKAITKYASEKDPKGTKYGLLQAKLTKVGKTSVTLTWKKVSGAKKYVIYGNKCGKKNKLLKQTTTTKTKYVFKKVNKKKVVKGTYYKFVVIALDKNNKVISTSKIVHAATTGGKVGNDKAVTTKAKKNKVTVKKGKTFKLGAKPVPASKKLKVKRHRGLSYESSNTKIATVSAKGVIKGKAKGKCKVYAYAQNGVCKIITVTVK